MSGSIYVNSCTQYLHVYNISGANPCKRVHPSAGNTFTLKTRLDFNLDEDGTVGRQCYVPRMYSCEEDDVSSLSWHPPVCRNANGPCRRTACNYWKRPKAIQQRCRSQDQRDQGSRHANEDRSSRLIRLRKLCSCGWHSKAAARKLAKATFLATPFTSTTTASSSSEPSFSSPPVPVCTREKSST